MCLARSKSFSSLVCLSVASVCLSLVLTRPSSISDCSRWNAEGETGGVCFFFDFFVLLSDAVELTMETGTKGATLTFNGRGGLSEGFGREIVGEIIGVANGVMKTVFGELLNEADADKDGIKDTAGEIIGGAEAVDTDTVDVSEVTDEGFDTAGLTEEDAREDLLTGIRRGRGGGSDSSRSTARTSS